MAPGPRGVEREAKEEPQDEPEEAGQEEVVGVVGHGGFLPGGPASKP